MDQFKQLFLATCNAYPRWARLMGSAKSQSRKDMFRKNIAARLYEAMQAQQPQPAPKPLPVNQNHKQNGTGSGTHTVFASQSSISQQARLLCGCKACRAGKGHV